MKVFEYKISNSHYIKGKKVKNLFTIYSTDSEEEVINKINEVNYFKDAKIVSKKQIGGK